VESWTPPWLIEMSQSKSGLAEKKMAADLKMASGHQSPAVMSSMGLTSVVSSKSEMGNVTRLGPCFRRFSSLPRHLPDWKRAILQSAMSSGSQRSRSNSSSSRGTWWEVVEIVEEDAGKRFRVRWAGKDPKTGKPWPLDWVPYSHCSSDLIKDWEKKKGVTLRLHHSHTFV
jgi:hypothetical protein